MTIISKRIALDQMEYFQ